MNREICGKTTCCWICHMALMLIHQFVSRCSSEKLIPCGWSYTEEHMMPSNVAYYNRNSHNLLLCASLIGRPPGLVYSVGSAVQRGCGPPPGWRPPQFQSAATHTVSPAVTRPMSAAPAPRPSNEVVPVQQRPSVTEQSAAGQQGMQFVPTQVTTPVLSSPCLIISGMELQPGAKCPTCSCMFC